MSDKDAKKIAEQVAGFIAPLIVDASKYMQHRCAFETTDSPEGDFCSCNVMKALRSLRSVPSIVESQIFERIKQVSQ